MAALMLVVVQMSGFTGSFPPDESLLPAFPLTVQPVIQSVIVSTQVSIQSPVRGTLSCIILHPSLRNKDFVRIRYVRKTGIPCLYIKPEPESRFRFDDGLLTTEVTRMRRHKVSKLFRSSIAHV